MLMVALVQKLIQCAATLHLTNKNICNYIYTVMSQQHVRCTKSAKPLCSLNRHSSWHVCSLQGCQLLVPQVPVPLGTCAPMQYVVPWAYQSAPQTVSQLVQSFFSFFRARGFTQQTDYCTPSVCRNSPHLAVMRWTLIIVLITVLMRVLFLCLSTVPEQSDFDQ